MKALAFLRIIDENGMLSLTNIAVLAVLVKLCIAPAVSLTEAGALLVALANYSGKKVLASNNQVSVEDPIKPQIDEMAKKIEDMTSTVSALSMQSGIKVLGL